MRSYKQNYYELKSKYSLIDYYQNGGNENKFVKVNEMFRNFAFPKLKNVNRERLLFTNESIYSITGVEGSKFIVDIINKYHKKNDITITDGTGNVGSDTIMFGLNYHKVNSIELDNNNYEALVNNIKIYGLENKISHYKGDTNDILDGIRQDIIYIDAPWGGRSYKKHKHIKLYIGGIEISDFYNKHKNNAELSVFKVPLNYDINNFIHKTKNKDMSLHIHIYFKKDRPVFKLIIITNNATGFISQN